MKKGILRIVDPRGRAVAFFCPGCKELHTVNLTDLHPCWSFNGDYDKPTFSPSILVRSGHYASTKKDDCWCNFEERFPDEGPSPYHCTQCHSFVTDGKIQFLSDCSHELAGQTVDLPDAP